MKYFEDMKELLNRYFTKQIIGFTQHMPIYFLANYICQTPCVCVCVRDYESVLCIPWRVDLFTTNVDTIATRWAMNE